MSSLLIGPLDNSESPESLKACPIGASRELLASRKGGSGVLAPCANDSVQKVQCRTAHSPLARTLFALQYPVNQERVTRWVLNQYTNACQMRGNWGEKGKGRGRCVIFDTFPPYSCGIVYFFSTNPDTRQYEISLCLSHHGWFISPAGNCGDLVCQRSAQRDSEVTI